MKTNLRRTLLASTILAGAAFLGSTGPASANVTTGPCPSVGFATLGCDLVINLVAGGIGTVANGPSHGLAKGTLDNSDDTLIGVTNNSGGTISAIKLTSKFTIFGFERDGAGANPNPTSGKVGAWKGYSVATPAGENTAKSHGPTYSGTTSTGADFNLSGPLNSFSGITSGLRMGIVNFLGGGLANGATAWFSLEEPLTSASFTVNQVPEPGSLALLGTALLGFGLLRRRRKT